MPPINGNFQLRKELGLIPFYRLNIKILLLPYEQTSFH
jgi:hypothetical protein